MNNDKVSILQSKDFLKDFEKENVLPFREESVEEEFELKKDDFSASLDHEAFHGIAGKVVKMIEPHTEADNAALLINFLVGFGNLLGRQPHFVVESKKHHVRLFAALVGKTSKGRKGSSWGHIKRILERVDSGWALNQIKSGLSSGEGLINQVRDELDEEELRKSDKRLLVMEEEFATTLRAAERPGNTLTALIRQAWDTGDIRTLTKIPLEATDSHISIISHVTKEELRRYLTSTEIGNGFANRFLWVIVQRSKVLPEGGKFHEENIDNLVEELNSIVKFSYQVGELKKDEQAREAWARVYEGLSEGVPGLVGAVTSRAEAQTMSLYALLDKSPVIRIEHLRAALAVWDYCFSSARYIFGQELGNPIDDDILQALKQRKGNEGLTRTEISKLFSNKRRKEELDQAIKLLIDNSFVKILTEKTSGRPKEKLILL
ncbi:hypothetical protein ACFFHM_18935 [Halalkalibacter kiskunsagensis]|uniref:DUF3987 domain-containing protein n=1 Tax=Halalkalibacter kiskunsagensis TaxID=1548599 RepID=A0ABV6KKG0_9BACI